MATESVNISTETMNRLRNYLVKKYEGRMHGRITSTTDIAINEYLDQQSRSG